MSSRDLRLVAFGWEVTARYTSIRAAWRGYGSKVNAGVRAGYIF